MVIFQSYNLYIEFNIFLGEFTVTRAFIECCNAVVFIILAVKSEILCTASSFLLCHRESSSCAVLMVIVVVGDDGGEISYIFTMLFFVFLSPLMSSRGGCIS